MLTPKNPHVSRLAAVSFLRRQKPVQQKNTGVESTKPLTELSESQDLQVDSGNEKRQ